jgi:hypothetical protein
MVNIRINHYPNFSCPPNWTVEQVVIAIRSGYAFNGGYITRNGLATLPTDVIEDDGDYEFVNPLPQPQSPPAGNYHHFHLIYAYYLSSSLLLLNQIIQSNLPNSISLNSP